MPSSPDIRKYAEFVADCLSKRSHFTKDFFETPEAGMFVLGRTHHGGTVYFSEKYCPKWVVGFGIGQNKNNRYVVFSMDGIESMTIPAFVVFFSRLFRRGAAGEFEEVPGVIDEVFKRPGGRTKSTKTLAEELLPLGLRAVHRHLYEQYGKVLRAKKQNLVAKLEYLSLDTFMEDMRKLSEIKFGRSTANNVRLRIMEGGPYLAEKLVFLYGDIISWVDTVTDGFMFAWNNGESVNSEELEKAAALGASMLATRNAIKRLA